MTAKELFSRSVAEIIDHFEKQSYRFGKDSDRLGLDTRAIFYSDSSLCSKVLKKSERIIVLSPRQYIIYYQNDENTYMRVRVVLNAVIEVEMYTCKYITGRIVDRKRFTR